MAVRGIHHLGVAVEDVDDAVSLRRLCVELASASVTDTTRGYSAPATTDCLARWRIPELLTAA